jgi:hypothetical protein
VCTREVRHTVLSAEDNRLTAQEHHQEKHKA